MNLKLLLKVAAALAQVGKVAQPLPTAGNVKAYLTGVGVVSPVADAIEPVWEYLLTKDAKLAELPTWAAAELIGSKPEGISADTWDKIIAALTALGPAVLAIIQVIQMFTTKDDGKSDGNVTPPTPVI
jgi:hypothetical protein